MDSRAPASRTAATPWPAAVEPGHLWQAWLGSEHALRRQSLRLMGGNRAEAEDALSAALLRAAHSFPTLKVELVDEQAWLKRVLYSVCMDLHRRRRSQRALAAWGGVEQELPRSPEQALLERERRERLGHHLRALPSPLREPLALRLVEGWPYADIARRLGLTVCNARKRVQLALQRLRALGLGGE